MDSRHLLFSLLWGSELLREKLSEYFNLLMVGAWLKEERTGAYTVWVVSCFWNRTQICTETRTKLLTWMLYFQTLPWSSTLRKLLAISHNSSIPHPWSLSKTYTCYNHVSKTRHGDSNLTKYFPVQRKHLSIPLVWHLLHWFFTAQLYWISFGLCKGCWFSKAN